MKGFEDKEKNIVFDWSIDFATFKEIVKKNNLEYRDIHKEKWDSYSAWQKEDIQKKGIREIAYDSVIAGHNVQVTLNFINGSLIFVIYSTKDENILKVCLDVYNELRKTESLPSEIKNFDTEHPEKILEENDEEVNPIAIWKGEDTTIKLEIEQKFSPKFSLIFYKSGDENKVLECKKILYSIRAYK